jgi:hypothetical protein
MPNNDLYRKHVLASHVDDRGTLTVFDKIDQLVPWTVKRSYWITDVAGQRGAHCVKGEKKFYVMARGSCTMRIFDGSDWHEEKLHGPSEMIEFRADLWREIKDFSEGAVLFTLCNEHYDRSKYITSLEEYNKYINNKT